ncbi:tuberous sclerosis 1 [Ophiostoma piceae UAMH 11346]|uniref:Tuberous sclerosis 1 n=1 Tax=Ophiostoma piceae (strain UAMH 11346) TaxID=1262450 RepID=S3C7C4_OPHP1|nr:tuberous sclerosis 1 [Ophiostoma piceae UAMH 11346]
MSSSGSTRDLNKAVHTFMSTPTLPLPDELTLSIEAYVDKHAEYEQSASDRLQDDLLATFARSVQGRAPLQYAAFLAILRLLRPAIRSTAHVLQWWEKVVEPVFAHLGEERTPSSEVLSDIGLFLVPDDEDDETEDGSGAQDVNRDGTAFAVGHRLAQKWMDVCDTSLSEDYRTNWHKEQPVQDILVLFGKKKPREFFTVLNDFFVQNKYRTGVITLLSVFFHNQPPHLHLIIKTPLFENLLRCLQLDSSTTVVSLALTCLTMLLPNMPGSIVPYLPPLFSIYARVLFWDREHTPADDFTSTATQSEQSSMHQDWEKCSYPAETDSKMAEPNLLRYFNVLYGLYPLNFMDYIRKPQRYLRHANASDDVEVQPSEIRDRSEKFRRCHVLHPNFYSLTIESEKTDFGRWMRSATADVVAECVSLYTPIGDMQPLHDDVAKESSARGAADANVDAEGERETEAETEAEVGPEIIPGGRNSIARLSASTGVGSLSGDGGRRRSSQLSHPADTLWRDSGADSPTLAPLLSASASRTDLQGLIDSNKAIKSGMYQSMPNDSVPSLSLSHQDSIADRLASVAALTASVHTAPSPLHHLHSGAMNYDTDSGSCNDATLTEVRRQILLLKNDLSFERYMVQQHLAHIGALRRSSVRQAVTESETQKLIIVNRTLKRRLEEAKKTEAQVKKEAEMSRNRHKTWGDSLANKLKVLRDEQKKWTADEVALRHELKVSQEDGARLLALVCEAEVRELKAKQDMQMLESAASEMEKLKDEVKSLATAKHEQERLKEQVEELQEEVDKLENMLEMQGMKMEAREAEFVQTRGYFQQQVETLNKKLTELLRDGPPADSARLADTRAQVESALAASRAKHLELQKNHTRLVRKYKVLESKSLERTTSYEDPGYASVRGNGRPLSTLSDPETDTFRPQGLNIRGSIGGGSSAGSIGSGGGTARYQQAQQQQRPRVASDAGSFDATSPGSWGAGMPISASLGSNVSPTNTFPRRPSTPTGSSQAAGGPRGEAPGSTSPQAERYYGRGGVQNSLRKDRKDKKPDEPVVEKKKPTGMRGIRGFV